MPANDANKCLCSTVLAGTGKTTIARRVGMLFRSLDLLASSEVVECSASDFVTGYANQSGELLKTMLKFC
jgi:hypothetical protein